MWENVAASAIHGTLKHTVVLPLTPAVVRTSYVRPATSSYRLCPVRIDAWSVATTLVNPDAVTVLNVTVESCAGVTDTFEPAGVLKSVKIARTISASISVYSSPLPLAPTVDGQPPDGN